MANWQSEGPFEPAPGPPPPAYPYGPPTGSPYGHLPNGYGYGNAAYGTDSEAVVSLVTGILGLVFCPYILGPVAVVTGVRARNRVRESQGRLEGEGVALAGIILGAISMALIVLTIGLIAALVVAGAFAA